MAYPFRDYCDNEELYMDAGDAEDNALAQALQNSLETLGQEREETSQIPGDTVQISSDTHEVPQLSFSAEAIADDERRRERELYGPPTPPRTSRAAALLNPTPVPFTPRASDKTNNNSENKATKYFDQTSKNTSEDNSIAYAIHQAAIKTVNKAIVEHFLAMKGISPTDKTRNLSITDKLLAKKIGTSFDAAYFPTGDPLLETLPNITDSEAVAAVAGADPYLQDAEAFSAFFNTNRGQHSPRSSTDGVAGSPASSDVADGYIESVRAGEHFDDMIARTHATRLAAIDAALDSQNSGLGASLQAARARTNTRGGTASARMPAARDQSALVGPSHQGAADSAVDEELERFLGESPTSPRADSKEDRPPHQKTRPQ